MQRTDKFLIGIVAGIVLLVAAALVITLARPEATYQAQDTPKGVAHNYLLALHKQDYEHAHSYLSPTLPGYPASADRFARDVQNSSWNFRLDVDTTLAIENVVLGQDWASVKVRESRFSGGDLFDSDQSFTFFEMQLQFEGNDWKIVDSRYYTGRTLIL